MVDLESPIIVQPFVSSNVPMQRQLLLTTSVHVDPLGNPGATRLRGTETRCIPCRAILRSSVCGLYHIIYIYLRLILCAQWKDELEANLSTSSTAQECRPVRRLSRPVTPAQVHLGRANALRLEQQD